ncbi:dolichyl-diphosphooligosaccharide--protein glycotransferase OST3 NDAI_0B04020 [Naumovozyma dairenensis CBS 421]|uniref:Dolichyl-diphosphooligosaccharide--protein glycosyltransferase subunit 3 n=1 Tax=Naumovozyma dairenensis (strain ATCC 10597 / BCRC 20456 / CBS 421 / NBRC 0211 / NRRL Y-12639) TaxID=1071378 RepID=G0W6M5_NAUDC|nr:hypothetical protein NDAI_0B04020 [Naumovozyma dairenensis CBS 421]CCD23436.1 hypothetical protein NDAI_0B04020 [Naumovozyma dairenensis CBS 421]
MKLCIYSSVLTILSLCTFGALALDNASLLKEARKSSDNIINVSGKDYETILSGHRDANILVLFTSNSPQFGCSLCAELESEYEALVSSWFHDHPDALSKDDSEKALFFAKAMVKSPQNIPKIFADFGIEQIPRLHLLKAGSNNMLDSEIVDIPADKDIARVQHLINALKSATSITDFEVHEKVNWGSTIITAVSVFIIVFLLKKHTYIATYLLNSRLVWGVLSVSFIILMIGGHMFNKIRNTMLAGTSKNGEIIYFIPNDFQNQFAIETQAIGVVYGILATMVVTLAIGIPKLGELYKGNKRRSVVEASFSILCALFVYMFFAALTYVFNLKTGGYPFQLLKISSLFH